MKKPPDQFPWPNVRPKDDEVRGVTALLGAVPLSVLRLRHSRHGCASAHKLPCCHEQHRRRRFIVPSCARSCDDLCGRCGGSLRVVATSLSIPFACDTRTVRAGQSATHAEGRWVQ